MKVKDNCFHNLPEYLHFFKNNKFNIIAIQETRVLGKCEQKGNEFVIYFSGGDGKAEYSVGIVACIEWADRVIHTACINDRMMWIITEMDSHKYCFLV